MAPDRTRHPRRRFLRGGLALAGLGLLSGCGMLPPRAPQPVKVARIGYLTLIRSDDPARMRFIEAFRQGLRERGWVEGENVALDSRSAEGQADRLPALAAELVRLNPDVVVAAGGFPTVRAVMDATGTIPIVLPSYGGDPVADGIVAGLARPGGNVTGLTNNAPESNGKRLQLLKEVAPGVSRVAVLWNAANAVTANDWRDTQTAAPVLGVKLLSLVVHGPDGLDGAFRAAIEEAPDALLTLPDAITLTYRSRIIDFAAEHRLPGMYGHREIVDDGGLMMYGANLRELFRRAATHVDKLLKGARPTELPVERPTTFEIIVNLRTAQALGLTIPPSILQQATEIIQ